MGYTPTEETEEPKSWGGGRARPSLIPVGEDVISCCRGWDKSLVLGYTMRHQKRSSCPLRAGRAKSIKTAAGVCQLGKILPRG